MIIKTKDNTVLEKALKAIQEKYENNLAFENLADIGKTRDNRFKIRFTLKTKDSKKAGSRISFSGRRMPKACWHAHGDFFDAIFKIDHDAEINSAGKIINIDKGSWEDWNIGSVIQPLYYSEACNCE